MARLTLGILWDTLKAALIFAGFLIVVVCISVMAQGQTISSSPVLTPIPDHHLHASVHDMAVEQSLYTGSYGIGVGEQPLAEVYHPAPEIPLGTIARICRDDARDPRCIYKGEL